MGDISDGCRAFVSGPPLVSPGPRDARLLDVIDGLRSGQAQGIARDVAAGQQRSPRDETMSKGATLIG